MIKTGLQENQLPFPSVFPDNLLACACCLPYDAPAWLAILLLFFCMSGERYPDNTLAGAEARLPAPPVIRLAVLIAMLVDILVVLANKAPRRPR